MKYINNFIFKTFLKFITIKYRKNQIINKIIKRSNICLYDINTGLKFKLIFNISNIKYNPCNGNEIKIFRKIWIDVYLKNDCYTPITTIYRNGDIKSYYGYKIKQIKEEKNYHVLCDDKF